LRALFVQEEGADLVLLGDGMQLFDVKGFGGNAAGAMGEVLEVRALARLNGSVAAVLKVETLS
jgi:hypothetical protein